MRILAVFLLFAGAIAAAVVLRPAPDPDPAARPAERPARPARPAAAGRDGEARSRPVRRARCPAGLENCREATGRVIFVEAVDPDGDGDAHYVLAGGNVTAPGLSVIDVGKDLRPRRLPRRGDIVSAAGPVFTGSYGQLQIQAVVVHQRRRTGDRVR